MEQKSTHPKFVRWAVLLGIMIALNLFFVAARSLVIAEPNFEDFCPTSTQQPMTQESCVAENGVWIENQATTGTTVATKPEQAGYCDMYQTCQPLYDDARSQYELYSFALMVGLGVLALIVGVVPMGSSIVSSGLSYGGVLALIIASGGYWSNAGEILRLVMSLIALGALLYVGIKRFKD